MDAKFLILPGLLAMLAACNEGSSSHDAGDPASSSSPSEWPSPAAGNTASQYPSGFMTSAGGRIAVEGIALDFPKDALEQPQVIQIANAGGSTSIGPAGAFTLAPAYDLGPDGLSFSKPVTVSISYANIKEPLTELAQRLTIYRNSEGEAELLPSVVHEDSAIVSATTSHFSTYYLGIPLDRLHCDDIPGLSRVCDTGVEWACELRNWILANRDCESDDDDAAQCGNAAVEEGEACEIGEARTCEASGYSGHQTCNPDCSGWGGCVAGGSCGDGVVNGPEACEPGQSIACSDAQGYHGQADCLPDCTGYGECAPSESCGDGVLNGPEGCDSGPDCGGPLQCACDCSGIVPASCGNGVEETGEGCDGDSMACNDGCYEGLVTCYGDCSGYTPCDIALQRCGDGKVQGCEVCDKDSLTCTDGCYQGTQACDIDCRGYGECSAGSQECGNGITEGCEECDDGNAVEHDGCNAYCQNDEVLPHVAGTVDVGGNVLDIGTDGSNLYVLMTTSHPRPPQTHFHLLSYDISNPVLPVLLQTIELPPSSWAKAIKIVLRWYSPDSPP